MLRVDYDQSFSAMARVTVLHWKAHEAQPALERLASLGHRSELLSEATPATLRVLRECPPDAIIIDLTRMPSHGREIGVALRASKKTRHVPLIFAGGIDEKVERVRELLPDATYAGWDEIDGAIRRALAYVPVAPVVPPHGIENPEKPIAAKLGVKEGMRIALIDAPDGVERILGDLPDGVTLTARQSAADALRLCFIRTVQDLRRRLPAAAALPPKAALWMCWPKKASGYPTDLTQYAIRAAGLDAGLVDNKICSMDATWTAMRFAIRKTVR